MAYDEQRTFATPPALHNVLHVDHGGRKMYGREQSIGFQYTNQPPYVPGGPLLTGAYAPAGPIHMAGPSRRPLPTPRTRPESMPPPPRQSPLIVQAPAPSRPIILAPSATLVPSPTIPPARRPLPTPTLAPSRSSTKHGSIDLTARPVSPVKSIINTLNANPDHDLRIPSSFSRRTAPLPDVNQRPLLPTAPAFSTPPTWPQSSRSDTYETQDSVPAPLWNRNVPAPSSAQIGPNVMERRSTVSGGLPPTAITPAAPTKRPDPPRSVSPERPPPAKRPQFSPSRRPLPSSPTEPPRIPSLHQRVPPSLADDQEPSSPSDVSSTSDSSYEPMTFADPMQADDDDVERPIVFAKNADIQDSPTYGIRDLPTHSRMAIANRDESQDANAVVSDTQQELAARPQAARPMTLPSPPTFSSSPPQGQSQTSQSPKMRMSTPVSSPFTSFSDRTPSMSTPAAEPQSLTLRFASIGLAEESARERQRQTQQEVPAVAVAQSPTRNSPLSPVRQQQGWPGNVPPLPRTPGNNTRTFFGTTGASTDGQPSKPNGMSSPAPASLPTSPTHPAPVFSSSPSPNSASDRKSITQQTPRPPPHPQPQQVSQLSERQRQKQRARDTDIDLDDAPPPSLRRSPSPNRQGFAQAPVTEITNDTPPRRQWTPSRDVTSRSSSTNGNGTSNASTGFHGCSHSPERRGRLPVQPPIKPPTQFSQTALPKISLPGGHNNDNGVDDDASGPGIIVSGPADSPSISVSPPGPPADSISEAPGITVSEHGAPVISVSAATDPPSIAVSLPKISVSESAHPHRRGPSPAGFGSRHTQIQESSPLHPTPGRVPSSKRGLPPPPSTSNAVRPNGLSCEGCHGPIVGRIVSAMGQRWHPHCFRCSICNELLEHVSSYERDGKPYCHLDYHEAFAPRCFHCKTAIIDERFITLDDEALGKRTYHEQHFFCAECGDPFLTPSGPLPPSAGRTGELNFSGDGEFVDDDVGFTVYRGHPYCEACHVRLRMPKCKACKKSIRDGARAVEALGGKWCWGCFVCESCKKPFEDPSFFLRDEKPFCEPCFSLMLRNEV